MNETIEDLEDAKRLINSANESVDSERSKHLLVVTSQQVEMVIRNERKIDGEVERVQSRRDS